MNRFFTSHATRIRSAAILAAVATSGFFSVAHAQPRGPQPGWGNQNPNWGNRDGRFGNDPWNEREVMSGEVVRRYSNTEYDLRAGDGHTFRVRSDDAISLNRGDDVRVSGDWRGSTFYARSITLVDNDNGFGNWGDRGDWNNGFRNRTDLTGIVAQRFGTQSFELRTLNGRTYLVRGDNSTPNLRQGDRVRVTGLLNGNRLRATSIANLTRNGGVVGPGGGWGNGGGWNNRYPNQPYNGNWGNGRGNDAGVGLDVDFPARLESIDRNRREATVRGDNGRVYTIRANRNELEGYRSGDRIRVRGTVRNNFIDVDDLNRIR